MGQDPRGLPLHRLEKAWTVICQTYVCTLCIMHINDVIITSINKISYHQTAHLKKYKNTCRIYSCTITFWPLGGRRYCGRTNLTFRQQTAAHTQLAKSNITSHL